MLDLKFIQKNQEKLQKAVTEKNIILDLPTLIALIEKHQKQQKLVERMRAERNSIAEMMKEAMKSDDSAKAEIISKGSKIKKEIAKEESTLQDIQKELDPLVALVPQIPSKDTPIGPNEDSNVEVYKWYKEDGGAPPNLDFDYKDHVKLGTQLDILDLERGVKTSGFRGYYLKNEGALMHMALMQYGMKKMVEKGFSPFVTPTIVRSEALFGSGHFPFDEENIYAVDSLKHTKESEKSKEMKYLAGTAEPSLLNYHAGETLSEEDLPIKLVGFSPCYRSEIGSHGKDTKGIYRIHEFLKIEQIVICKNSIEESEEWHQRMLTYSKELLEDLELPYRVIQVCTGDMGAGKYKMFDIETWMPSRDSYGETHSASNLLDWQARRLGIRFKSRSGEKFYPYMLNNTVVASPRILIAIWENYQTKEGNVNIPEVLRPYIGKDIIKR